VKIHHLNAGSICPLLGPHAICHCLLIETPRSGLVLVDTGIGHAVSETPQARMTCLNRVALRPRFDLAESALTQVRALGFRTADVRHIVVTHLDVDHAGGLQDFPQATVHIHGPELSTAQRSSGDPRFSPPLWAHGPRWETYDVAGEQWHGLGAVRTLRGLPPDLALVPLAGHTLGHTGVAVQGEQGRWLLHAGDAYLDRREIVGAPLLWGTRVSAWLTSADRRARHANLQRIKQLVKDQADELDVFCAHSVEEFTAFTRPTQCQTSS
jgi:glyoxylase-like metal-dependent hydrolase (beta-lactamase superfamily II)